MYRIESLTSSNRDKYDEYVFAHADKTPYHLSAWQFTCEQAYKMPTLGRIAYLDDKVVGILPAVHLKRPIVSNLVCSLPYCDLGHALVDNDEVKQALLDSVKSELSQYKAAAWEYRDTATKEDLTTPQTGEKVRMLLPLPESAEVLLKSFKSKLRSQIKKAEKNGLTAKIGSSAEYVNEFYQVYAHNMRDLGSPPHSIDWFKTLANEYQNHIQICLVEHDNKCIGAGIILLIGNKACIPWASTLREHNRLAPNMLLYWALLAHCADSGIEEFDFGRSSYGEGTYKFKAQWGAQYQRFENRIPNTNQPKIQEHGNSRLRAIFEKALKKMPVNMLISFGGALRKYISL